MMDPAILESTRLFKPAFTAKSPIISSGRLLIVAFRNPPAFAPAYEAIRWVERPISQARGIIDRHVDMKTNITSRSTIFPIIDTGTKTSKYFKCLIIAIITNNIPCPHQVCIGKFVAYLWHICGIFVVNGWHILQVSIILALW